MEFEGYCVKCREKRTGRKMAKGACPVCGTTVTRFLPAEDKK